MKVKEKLMLDRAGLEAHGAVNIVIFGDSVSHGAINGYFDYESVYWNRLKRRLHEYRDYMPINMINSAIGGTTATQSLSRLERDVTKHEPDLVIVCFGLNDTHGELSDYLNSLESIFGRCKEIGSDVIFLTPNMMNTYVAEDTPREHYNAAFKTADIQNCGRMDEFIYSAIDLAHRMDVTVCDCYSKWKEMSKTEDTTMLLANRINHPIPQMHALFADGLYELIMK